MILNLKLAPSELLTLSWLPCCPCGATIEMIAGDAGLAKMTIYAAIQKMQAAGYPILSQSVARSGIRKGGKLHYWLQFHSDEQKKKIESEFAHLLDENRAAAAKAG